MAEEAENAFDKLKAGAKAVAKKVTDPSKDLGDEYNKENVISVSMKLLFSWDIKMPFIDDRTLYKEMKHVNSKM